MAPKVDNSILCGAYIYKHMTSNENLVGLTKGQIYPLLAPADTKYPYVVYSRTNITPIYTKDILSGNAVDFEIVAVSDSYDESIEVANSLRNVLEGFSYADDDIRIYRMKVSDITEETNEDAFIQRLYFNMTVD